MCAVLINPERYLSSVKDGVILFWAAVLPALFPFFFFTRMLTGLGFPETVGKFFEKPVKFLFPQQKIVLTNEIQNHQVKQSEVNLTLDQMKEVLEEAKEYVLKNNDEMMKFILSRFIHKIIIHNEAIEIEYNLGGFFVEFKKVVLIETKVYSKKEIYAYSPLKEVS